MRSNFTSTTSYKKKTEPTFTTIFNNYFLKINK